MAPVRSSIAYALVEAKPGQHLGYSAIHRKATRGLKGDLRAFEGLEFGGTAAPSGERRLGRHEGGFRILEGCHS